MVDSEVLDFFPNNTKKGSANEAEEFNLDEEVFNPGRSKINDYKHSSSTIHKDGGSPQMNNYNQTFQNEKKNNFGFNDERVIWAGAISLFLLVLVFFIGYNLGKTSVKEITLNDKKFEETVASKLEQKKLENIIAQNPQVSPDQAIVPNPNASQTLIEGTKPVIPETQLQPENTPKITVQPGETVQNTEKKVVLQNPVKKETVKKTQKTAEAGESFTIQISAHTAMDKARAVEDELRKMGFQSYLVETQVNGTTYYRVRVGKFNGKTEAQSALSKIKASSIGKDSFILNLK